MPLLLSMDLTNVAETTVASDLSLPRYDRDSHANEEGRGSYGKRLCNDFFTEMVG